MNQLIFVINSGSSSLKFQLIEMPAEEVKFNGIFERIGAEQADLTYTYRGIPIIEHNRLVGAIGVSGGTVEEDQEIAEYAINFEGEI